MQGLHNKRKRELQTHFSQSLTAALIQLKEKLEAED